MKELSKDYIRGRNDMKQELITIIKLFKSDCWFNSHLAKDHDMILKVRKHQRNELIKAIGRYN